nr:mucin-7-like [Penaeus vannamei]
MDQLMAAREQGKLAYFSYRTLVIKEKSIKPKSTPNMTQPAPPRPATPPEAPPSTSLNAYPVLTRRPSAANHVSVTRPPPTASSAAPTSGSGSTETTRDHDTAHSANDLSETTWPTHTGAVPKRSTDGTHDVEETLPLEGATGPFAATDASCPSQRRVQQTRKSTDFYQAH